MCKSGFILRLTFLKLCKSGIILILCLFQFAFFFAQCILSTGNLLFTTGDLCFSTRQLLLGVCYLSRRIRKFRSCVRSALLQFFSRLVDLLLCFIYQLLLSNFGSFVRNIFDLIQDFLYFLIISVRKCYFIFCTFDLYIYFRVYVHIKRLFRHHDKCTDSSGTNRCTSTSIRNVHRTAAKADNFQRICRQSICNLIRRSGTQFNCISNLISCILVCQTFTCFLGHLSVTQLHLIHLIL